MAEQLKTSHTPFRWVILLLTLVVILPTVCLLWFMNQTVRNERLVIRQKLIDLYHRKFEDIMPRFNPVWLSPETIIEQDMLDDSITRAGSIADLNGVVKTDGILIFDPDGKLIYPILLNDDTLNPQMPERYYEAQNLEHDRNNPRAAFSIYLQIALKAGDEYRLLKQMQPDSYNSMNEFKKFLRRATQLKASRTQAQRNAVRCLRQQGKIDEALDLCRKIVNIDDSMNFAYEPVLTSQIAYARLSYTELLQKADHPDWCNHLYRMFTGSIYDADYNLIKGKQYDYDILALPADVRIFALEQTIELISRYENGAPDPDKIRRAQWLLDFEKTSLTAADSINPSLFNQWPDQSVLHLPEKQQAPWAVKLNVNDHTVILLRKKYGLHDYLNHIISDLSDQNMICSVVDAAGNTYGPPPGDLPLFTQFDLPQQYLQNWNANLYFRDADLFDKAARKQTAIYLWTGILVIALLVISAGFAGGAVSRQIKLNRLKNDFIATVTHELKTPLASMRILVDTLREGRTKDRQQARDYLELIVHENQRLTRLIDNFLAFSRMERHKQTFEFQPVAPAAIVDEAAEAVKARFDKHGCSFHISIADDLPTISVDQDSMVTVLINLLDNACKYTHEQDKQIRLRVERENNAVKFEVQDNGIGIPPKARKRIFDRFYQVDQTLARRTEGCGLGLSIVKYILDAHHADISVNSLPGQGAIFTVKIPV